AEGLALLGAERIFTEHKPRFAVCLYHTLEHMWVLPRLLKAYCPDYRFWCKKSAPEYEFVLFGEVQD
ncbi:MAG: FkbM family methyltransferase, partial [Bilophila sp.]